MKMFRIVMLVSITVCLFIAYAVVGNAKDVKTGRNCS